jgi:hypothetical protein
LGKGFLPLLFSALSLSAIFVLLLVAAPQAQAQATGSLSGTVRDDSGAVIPGAAISVVNVSSKAKRSSVSNGEGFFTLTALQSATYDVVITAKGFNTLRIVGVEIDPGDSRTIDKLVMKLGTVESEVTVTALTAGVALDSGEKSSLITADDIKRLSTVGRDATELIKMLPGFAVSTGGGLNNTSTGVGQQTVGFGSSVSSFSANGATPQTGATSVISDGANVMDPGDMGASISTVNMDMVQEVKVSTSNFGAESAKGPVIIQTVGKSGGSTYHGSAYLFARNGALNANDWLNNYNSVTRPDSKYYYPGANIGGPVKVPGTSFNRSKKMTFFAGFEYYGQTKFDQLLTSFVPTARMIGQDPTNSIVGADLTPATIASALNITTTQLSTDCPNFYTSGKVANSGGICFSPGSNGAVYSQQDCVVAAGGIIASPLGRPNVGTPAPCPVGQGLPVDPRALIYAKFWPKPNRTPRAAAGLDSDGYNYVKAVTSTHNGYQFHGRVDENFSDNTKLYATYNFEKINDQAPIQDGFYAGADIIPYPTSAYSNTHSNSLSLNFTHVFSPTLTNELVPAGTYFYSPQQLQNRDIVQDSSTGWTGGRYYNNGAAQLPDIIDYEQGVPDFAMSYFAASSKYFRKFSYSIGDNLTKQIRSHSIKLGAYYEETANNQVPYAQSQGTNSFNHYQSACTTDDGLHLSQLQNNIANFVQGCTGFSQVSDSNARDLYFRTLDFYATDEWKTTKKLTLTLAIRFDHLGPWFDPHGVGLAVWNPPTPYAPSGNVITQDPHTYPGISWHQTNPSIPLSGSPTTFVFYSPRFGLAYDLYGDGKTVFRGGFGAYRFHDSYNDSAGPLGTSSGTKTFTGVPNLSCSYAQITQAGFYTPAASRGGPCSVTQGGNVSPFSLYALDPTDKSQPVTYNYSFNIDQAFFKRTNLEFSYVGNQSHELFTEGNLSNQNVIQLGGLFQPDPITHVVSQPGTSQQVVQDYRPYSYYNQVYVPHHIAYGNYNSLQVSWTKQKGPLNFNINYTWSKALGIRGDYRTGAVGDPTVLRNNYGYLGFNRSQIVNFTYSYQVGNAYHGNRIVAALVNQWLISGITNLQSGPDTAVLNGTSNTNYNLSGGLSYTPLGTNTAISIPISNSTVLGTPDINLQPVVTCSPKSNLVKGSPLGRNYINGNCFALPKLGTNGTFNLPDVHGPMYFNSDLTVQRNIRLSDSKSLEFRLAGFNFLNHPLPQFYGGNQVGLGLSYGLPANFTATTPQQALANAVQNSVNFGYTPYKGGFRVVEVEARVNF